MAGWTLHDGLAVAFPHENIDTDQLIPARFMTTPRSEGYGQYLLHDHRRDAAGVLLEHHPLNLFPAANVLVARRNFGSGSSREAAVYALVDAGFKTVIAPSFGDIFANNAVNNGLLPALLPEETVEELIAMLPSPQQLKVDLDTRTITASGRAIPFEIDPVRQRKLIMGWDDIDLTRSEIGRITTFQKERQKTAPWIWPAPSG